MVSPFPFFTAPLTLPGRLLHFAHCLVNRAAVVVVVPSLNIFLHRFVVLGGMSLFGKTDSSFFLVSL